MTRLPFMLEDLAHAIAAISPETCPIVIVELQPASYWAVASELESHFNGQLVHGGARSSCVEWIRVGSVCVRKGDE